MNDTHGNGRMMATTGWLKYLFTASFLVFFLVGCAGKPPVALSGLHMEAIRHNQRGIKAEARGESPQALEEFSETLRISNSIENTEGIVVALVNSSRVNRHNGDAKAALIAVSRATTLVTSSSPLYSEVAFEMAQATLLSGELGEAAVWAEKAVADKSDVKYGMRVNLLARMCFLKGDLTGAEVKVREALHLNRELEMRAEEANSLRLLGDIQTADKRRVEAAESYGQALAIDKTIGKSRKIADDLRGLALLSLSQNNSDSALVYYQRSFTVSSTGGDRSGAADDLLKMSRIHVTRGEKDQSERLLAEREIILKKNR